MAEVVSYAEPKVLKGAVAGAIAGALASWVMTRFQVALSGRGLTDSENPQSNTPVEGRDDAAMKASNETGPAAHYALGITAGAFYGMLRETEHAPGGAAFGAELWVVADQLGLPIAGLSPWPVKAYPASTTAQHFAAHLVYGITTALTYRAIRRAL